MRNTVRLEIIAIGCSFAEFYNFFYFHVTLHEIEYEI